MKILVTGSAGMIGGYVVKGLVAKGHKVIGVDLRNNIMKFVDRKRETERLQKALNKKEGLFVVCA